MNVRGQVAVAQIEPVCTAISGQPLQRMEGLVTNSPALCWIHNPRKRVRHDIQIGRDFQAVKNDVVA